MLKSELGLFAVFCTIVLAVPFSDPASGAEYRCSDCHTNTHVLSETHQSLECADCHTNIKKLPHQARPLATLGGKQICRQCHEDQVKAFWESVHAKQQCSACHGSLHKGWREAKASCSSCHAKPADDFSTTTHSKKGVLCVDCHGNPHGIVNVSDPRSAVGPATQPNACAKCHDASIIQGYLQSNHGRGITASGLAGVAPTCSTCHGSHAIYARNNPHARIADKNVPRLCGSCHKGVLETWKTSTHGQLWEADAEGPICTSCHNSHAISDPRIGTNRIKTSEKCGGCHEARYETYRDTFHGKSTDLGFVSAAACSDCHTPHHMLPVSDARSTVNPNNLEKTCGNCHGNVSKSFVQFAPHVDPKHKESSHPVLHYVWFFMTVLLVGTFLFFVVHTLLWLQRAIVAFVRGELKPIHRRGDVWVRRFRPVHQWIHVTVVITFLILASTGLPLKFHFVGLAETLSRLLGGVAVARYFHRLAGVATFGYASFFVGYLLREIVIKKRYELLWGWKSMVPNLKDLSDIYHNVRWFLYLGQPPKLDRWTYWEKFDFFAVFWGVPVIGLSGLMLWFPRAVASILPGWVLNLASIIHGDEALLATGFIFFFHFFHTHMRPENFPLDTVVFTGKMPLERLKEERPAEYAHLKATGELEKIIVPKPSATRIRVAYTFGFAALSLGVLLGVLLIVAGFKVVLGMGV